MNDKEFTELKDQINYHVGQLNKLQKRHIKETGKFQVTNAWTESAYVPRAERVVNEITNVLYGKGLQVSGWHLNGDLEPMENFFDDNDWFVEEDS